jgi:predicted dehydrogenase
MAEPAFQLSYIYHVLGQRPVSVIAHAQHISDLPPGVNDIMDMIIELDSGVRINFHYALCEKHDYTVGNFLRFNGAGGCAYWTKQQHQVYDPVTKQWDCLRLPEGWTIEEAYLAEMKHFLAALNGKERYAGRLEVERDVLATLLAAEASSESGSREPVAADRVATASSR